MKLFCVVVQLNSCFYLWYSVLLRMLLARCVDVFVDDLFMFISVSFQSEGKYTTSKNKPTLSAATCTVGGAGILRRPYVMGRITYTTLRHMKANASMVARTLTTACSICSNINSTELKMTMANFSTLWLVPGSNGLERPMSVRAKRRQPTAYFRSVIGLSLGILAFLV